MANERAFFGFDGCVRLLTNVAAKNQIPLELSALWSCFCGGSGKPWALAVGCVGIASVEEMGETWAWALQRTPGGDFIA